MAKQTFSVGQTLTAAQMTSLQQTAMLGGAASAKSASYTLVAADAGTAISMSNASATTITVNTALFAAGDTVQITNLGVGVCTITAGTATVNTSSSLALAQYESGTLDFTSTSAAIFIKGAGAAASGGGITLIQETVASALSSLSFSSIPNTYKNLLLEYTGIEHSDSSTAFNIRFNNVSTGNLYVGLTFANTSAGSLNMQNDNRNQVTYSPPAFGEGVNRGNNFDDLTGYVYVSNYASTSKFKMFSQSCQYFNNSASSYNNLIPTQCRFDSLSAITSIDIFRVSGSGTFSNITDTSIRLYGVS